jgi:hypothetical protein
MSTDVSEEHVASILMIEEYTEQETCVKVGVNQKWLILEPVFTLVSCTVYSSTLKMEAIFSSETSVGFQRTTWLYIPESSTLHNHSCENLKLYF